MKQTCWGRKGLGGVENHVGEKTDRSREGRLESNIYSAPTVRQVLAEPLASLITKSYLILTGSL